MSKKLLFQKSSQKMFQKYLKNSNPKITQKSAPNFSKKKKNAPKIHEKSLEAHNVNDFHERFKQQLGQLSQGKVIIFSYQRNSTWSSIKNQMKGKNAASKVIWTHICYACFLSFQLLPSLCNFQLENPSFENTSLLPEFTAENPRKDIFYKHQFNLR